VKLVRGAVLLLGLGVIAVLGAIEHGLSRRLGPAAAPPAETDPDWVTAAAVPSPSPAVARTRLALGVVGVAVAVFGGYVLLRDVAPASYLGLVIWLAAAVVLHDAVLVPLVTLLRAAAHRAGRRLPVTAIRLAEAGFLVAGSITVLVLPEIYAQHLGNLNPTVLPGSYARSLVLTWLVVAVATALAMAAVTLRVRRRTVLRGRLAS